jgi:outer membrane protein assembly complex protein YaeT
MDDRQPQDEPVEARHEGHHRSARERQRRGPMWGCLKAVAILAVAVLGVLMIAVVGGYWYLGTSSFADLVRLRVQKTLESRLGRTVTIRSVEIVRTRPQRVIIRDLRIANSPGAVSPYFATAREIDIVGGVESFWGRRISVDRVDIHDPRINMEIYPAGAKLVHNFPHWEPGPKSRYEIYHLTIGGLVVDGATMNFLDRRHDIAAVTTNMAARVNITSAKDLYEGIASSPVMTVRVQDYVPFDVDLRGRFRYTPGVLVLSSIALHGRDIEAFISGKLDPLSEGAYDLRIRSQMGLNRVREIFRVDKVLDGKLALDTRLRGKAGEFVLSGGWTSPKISADVYDLAALRGRLTVNGRQTVVDVDTARYGGGTIGAHYLLPQYEEPYPMSVDLRYNGVSLEKLFEDWDVKDTGLRGAATGRLAYHWNKDKVLEGAGEGSATLARSTASFSNAKYPLALGGSADFALDNGVVKFRRAELTTAASRVDFSGSLRIEDINTDLKLDIHSTDFSELDRAGYNFALSAGKKKYELLGLGGSGEITGTMKGRLKSPQVVAHIAATGTKFNNSLLGDSEIDLHYEGVQSILTLDRTIFQEAGGRLAMTGTFGFPDRGPSPTFDLAVDSAGYSVERAMGVVTLPFKGIHGLGTGRMIIAGTPDAGRVTFVNLAIAQGDSQLRLNGDVQWFPGKGTSRFNLDIAARSFPVADIVTFLDLGTFPVTGELTGTLHLSGTKSRLEGAGAVTVRKGSVFGEPVDVATADIAFAQGKLRATNVDMSAPAGQIKGEAELDLSTDKFSYAVQSSSIDLSKMKLLQSLAGLLGGKVTLSSTGAGTLENPELVVSATISDATLRGLALPPGTPPPQIYLAIRSGQLIVRGSAGDFLTIEGNGTVGANLAVDGTVRIVVSDLARFAALFPSTATLPVTGKLEVDLRLGGAMTSIETLQIDATVPVFDLRLSDHEFTAARPLRFGVRGGRLAIGDFELQQPGAMFAVTGSAELTGTKRLDLAAGGDIEAALTQLFVPGLRAEGHVDVALKLGGTMAEPQITGSAEMQGAQFRFPGFPQIIDQVTGRVEFLGDRIKVDGLQATIGGGKVVAGGTIGVAGLKPQNVNLGLEGTDVALRYFEGLTVEGSFRVVLKGDMDRMTMQGDVTVNRALYFRDFDFGTALLNVVLSRRTVTPIVGASWQDHVNLDLTVTAGPNTLVVRNNIADVTGSGDLRVQGTLANPAVIGLVTLNEGGRVRLQNNDYRVVSGSINFQNPFRIDPYFDITLEGRVSNVGFSEFDQGGPITVTINLTGTIDRFTPTISSDPPASDITLFSLLGFGALENRTGTTNATASPGVALLGQSLIAQSLLRTLPFAGSFTYDPGLLDTTEDPGAKVVFQRQISSKLRVLVIYNLQHPHSRSLVEWQVNPEWTLQITRDEVRNEYRIEGRFRRRYDGHWTWGRRGEPVALSASVAPLTSVVQKVDQTSTVTAPPPTGPPVTQIHYRADAAFDTALLTNYMAVTAGQPLSTRAVQSSIKSLFATGEFRDIRVETTPSGAGVAVTFVLSLNYRVGEIHIEGLTKSMRDRAGRDLKVHTGDVLSLNAVDHSAVVVQQFLTDNGYLEATVDPETQFQRASSRAVITFRATPGPLARIGTVSIEGPIAPFTTAALLQRMRRGPGETFKLQDARRDADRMERSMIRDDYRKADIRYLGYKYDQASKTVALRYSATAGPKVRVEVAGVPRRSVRSVLPFDKNQAYSEDVIDQAAEKITKLYQQRGYFNAVVDTQSGLQPDGTWVTTFKVNPGQKFRLAVVKFSGNQNVSDKKLAGVVTTSPQRGFRAFFATLFRHGGVTREQIGADRDALESYYRLNGFSEVQVGSPVVTTEAASGTMAVEYPIVEGPQTIVSAVRIEGNEQVRAHDLPNLELRSGKPLNPQLLHADVMALQNFYADRGNAEVQITTRPDISADKRSATVTYVIAEGPRIKVGDIIVRGNTYTRSKVVIREADLKPGEPFSYTSVLEAQRNLYRLGIFQRAEVQPEQAGTATDQRNIVLQVEEGRDLTLSGSIGGTKQTGRKWSLLATASVANRNLFGTGRYIGLDLVRSTGGERSEAFLTYREPFVGPYNVPLTFTLFNSSEQRPGAMLQQRGASLEAAKVFRQQTRWSIRYEYRNSACKSGETCVLAAEALIPGVDRNISNKRISDITPTFFWDHRDDPIDPHRGFFTSASLQYAFPVLQARTHFLKEYAQVSYYLPLTARTVFAVSTRLGLIQGIRSTGTAECVQNESCIPLTERFTGGGESSHRAFPLDLLGNLCNDPTRPGCKPTLIQLGENGPIAPIGGKGIFIANFEYRFPIFASVGGALFTDIGNVFADSAIHFNDLRYGVGGGIRYLSPVGPLRFDVGRKIHPRPYEKSFAYFVTLGYAF